MVRFPSFCNISKVCSTAFMQQHNDKIQQKTCTLLYLIAIQLCASQTSVPFTGFTAGSPLMPNPMALLLSGYQASENRIWLIGGQGDEFEKWHYDIDTNTFTDLGNISITAGTLNSQCSFQWGENLITFANEGILRDFSMATGQLSAWTATLPYNREAPCVAGNYDHRFIFVTGGILVDGESESESVRIQIYDISAADWIILDPPGSPYMVTSRGKHACVLYNTFLYVFGGVKDGAVVASNEKLDVSDPTDNNFGSKDWDNTISYLADNNLYFQRAVVDNTNNLIYLVGGRDDSYGGGYSINIQIYDPVMDTITLLSAPTQRLNVGRSSPAVILVNHRLYVFGGAGPTDTWEYSNSLTFAPTAAPTPAPTMYPTMSPTLSPTASPTSDPSSSPTLDPTNDPTTDPTADPTEDPTLDPTNDPSFMPTNDPTFSPTFDPTFIPTLMPTSDPTADPTKDPTFDPTFDPTNDPTTDPTFEPTVEPTWNPTSEPTTPTFRPSAAPTTAPTWMPSFAPSKAPTPHPIIEIIPTVKPLANPSVPSISSTERMATAESNGNAQNPQINLNTLDRLPLKTYILIGSIIVCLIGCCCLLILLLKTKSRKGRKRKYLASYKKKVNKSVHVTVTEMIKKKSEPIRITMETCTPMKHVASTSSMDCIMENKTTMGADMGMRIVPVDDEGTTEEEDDSDDDDMYGKGTDGNTNRGTGAGTAGEPFDGNVHTSDVVTIGRI